MLLNINLLPWRISQKEKQNKLLKRLFLSTLILNSIFIATIYYFLSYAVSLEERKINYFSSILAEYKILKEKCENMQQQKATLISKLQKLSFYLTNQKDQLIFLENIENINRIYVNVKKISKQADSLTISGQASGYESVVSFMTDMKNLQIFSKESLKEIELQDGGNKDGWQFLVTMNLKNARNIP